MGPIFTFDVVFPRENGITDLGQGKRTCQLGQGIDVHFPHGSLQWGRFHAISFLFTDMKVQNV